MGVQEGSVKSFDSGKMQETEPLPDKWTVSEDLLPDVIEAIKLGIPIMISQSARLVQNVILSVLLGRRDTVLLAAISTSNIWTEIVDEAARGGSSQIGVLCAQAMGSGKHGLVGIWLQMGILMVSVLYPIFALAKAATGPLLSYMGVPDILSVPAGEYALWVAPAIIFELLYGVLATWYYSQGVVAPDTIIQIIFVPLGSWLIWVLVDTYKMGLYGVAIALSIKRVARFFLYLGYTWYHGYHKKTWKGWDFKEVFVKDRWLTLISMAIPAAFGAIMEIVNFSLNSVFAARLGPTQSAAFDLNVCLNMLLFALVWGTCQGFGMIMAYRLGEGRPIAARGMVKAGGGIVYLMVTIVALLMYNYMHLYAELGSNDPAVREVIVSIRTIASVGTMCSGLMFLVTEVLSKQGRIGLVFMYITIFNWFVGMPMSFFLAPIYGVWGISLGVNCAYFLSFVCLSYHLYTSDWDAIAQQARKNAEVSESKMKESLSTEKPGEQ